MAPTRDRRTGFSRRRQYGVFLGYVLAVAGAVVGAALLALSTFNPPAFSALRMALAGLTTPVSTGLATATRGIGAVPDIVSHYFFVEQENRVLRGERDRNRALLLRARTIAYDNRRLRALLTLRDRTEGVVVAARLVSSTPQSGRRFALLNAGRWSGVLPGMPVRGPDGLIGRVLETGPNAARVLLLSDPESIVPVRRTRDGLPAIAAGRGDGLVDIRSVESTNVHFQPGDLFVSSGVGGIYPPGIPVARILERGSDTVRAHTFAVPDTFDFAIVERAFLPLPPPVSPIKPAGAPK
ncbi:rod shape-determining protein MreC [Sphingomonas sp. CROZ-RG-20F-R02-07]|uniref:rod shape-determining protein MreC n=1 Tax=Sphingomonas sp. CROZ-RG-20F-R02-07 TaxID=2914832 RepID=UPI001F5828FB|nr:rod shape-determining protein MreC [Sphingomonas sp. CROZ-RG-20F-R02-07]